MKLYIKVLLFLLVLGIATPFILKRPDGRPLMKISDLAPKDSEGISSVLKKLFHTTSLPVTDNASGKANKLSAAEEGFTKVHKWLGVDGQWHFSDQKPDNAHTELLRINPNQNILHLNDLERLKNSQSRQAAQQQTAPASNTGIPTDMIPGMPSISQAKRAIKQAQGIQDLLNERMKKNEDLLNKL